MIALGLWPESGHQEVLAWELAEGEDFLAWLTFLSRLEEQGTSAEQGLRLIIHDGGAGLCAALRFLDLGVAEQRCIFHHRFPVGHRILCAQDDRRFSRRMMSKQTVDMDELREVLEPLIRRVAREELARALEAQTVINLSGDSPPYQDLLDILQEQTEGDVRLYTYREAFGEQLRRGVQATLRFPASCGHLSVGGD